MIYFDQAATSLHRPPEVGQAVYDAILSFGNASRSIHTSSLQASRAIFGARQLIAQLFEADSPDQVSFTSNATEALNLVIQSFIKPSDHIITTATEHNSVLRPLYLQQKKGAELSIIPANTLGKVDEEEIIKAIRPNTKYVICSHASNVTGNLLDIKKIGDICQKYHLIFILDAAQTAGIFPISMKKDHIDIICFTGHKSLLGPQGTGGICLSSALTPTPVKVGGSGFLSESLDHPTQMPTAFEAGTLNGHGIAGLQAALTWLSHQSMTHLREKEQSLMWIFYDGIIKIPRVKIYGDFSQRNRSPIVSFNIGDEDSGYICDQLWEHCQIASRSGMHCAYKTHQALGTETQGVVRFSFSHFNTIEEVNTAIEAVKDLAELE